MKNTLATTEITMSSLDFLNDYINPAREEAGESIITKQSFLKKVESELKGELGVVQKNITEEINNLGFCVTRESKHYNLDQDQMMLIGMRESKGVRKSVLAKIKELSSPTQPALPASYKEALIALVAEVEKSEKLEVERDHAIKTKSQISDKKTATAMATASVMSKRVKQLESKLQDVGEYKSLLAAGLPQRIETEHNPKAQTWRLLVEISNTLGFPPKKVNDPRYGSVNTYHVKVIDEFISYYL